MATAASSICFVNSLRTWGGAEVWMLDAARGLADRGHRVSFVAQPGTPLLRRARSAGFPAAAIPIRFDAAPWTLAKLWRCFRRRRATTILCNLTKDLKAAGTAGRMAGVGRILALRESDFPLKNSLYYRGYFNRMADGVVVNSIATRRTVLTSAPWLDPRRVHLLYKWVDTERFRPADTRPANERRVGFLGQLIERKGLRELMTAWSRLESGAAGAGARDDRDEDATAGAMPHLAGATLHLAGEGPLRDEIEAWRDTLLRPESIVLEGYRDDAPEFLAGLSVLVLPSRSEGFGLAAAEASACGVPVVAADRSSLPEVVRHEQTGLLVPPRDPDTLAVALARLLTDPDLARRLGSAGREHVRRNFERTTQLDRLEEILADRTPPERGENER